MKRIFTLAITLMLLIASNIELSAQTRYAIFKTTGSVMVEEYRSKKPVNAKKRMSLSLLDSIQIGADASVSIIDNHSNTIYKSTSIEKFQIKDIIDVAREQSKNIANTLNKELSNQLSDNQEMKTSYAVMGATTRSFMMFKDHVVDSIYCALYDVMHNFSRGNAIVGNSQLNIKKIYTSDNKFTLEIENNSDYSYYINVVKIGYTADLCLTHPSDNGHSNAFIPANKTTSLNQYLFSDISHTETYILFASPKEFNAQDLQDLLHYMDDPLSISALPGMMISEIGRNLAE